MIEVCKVSVVVPCRNELHYIQSCVDSILSQDYSNIELLVCDGMSDDGTRDVLKLYENKENFKLIDNRERVTPIALNSGIQQATGDIVIIFGAHAKMNVDYVSKCVETFLIDPKIGCVGGVLNQVNENKVAGVIAKAMSSSFGVGNAYFRTGLKTGYVDTVAFGAYRKEVFDIVGFFDVDLVRNQDDEFNFRLLKGGFKIYLNPEIKADYFVRGSFQKLAKQYYQYGYWKVFVNRKHKTITTLRQLIPALLVFGLSASFILALFTKIGLMLFILASISYMSAALFFASKVSQSATIVFGVIRSFVILHFSYGTGYLKGIWDFLLFRKKQINQRQMDLSR